MVLSRREFIQGLSAAGAVALLPACGPVGGGATRGVDAAGEPVRFAHLADIHAMPELDAGQGLAKCLRAVHEVRPRPAFILTGGDLVHDARNATPERAEQLYDLFNRVARDSDLPMRHCIGNHDCFGWGPHSPIATDHAGYGKQLFRERLGLDELTYAFDAGGWRICVIDNILPTNFDGRRGYQGGFDEATLDFVDRQLNDAGERPKLICTHIPIVSATVLTYTDDVSGPHRPVPTSLVTRNSRAILNLLHRHRVELLLAGHLHQRERIRYQHTTHIGQGAVSGRWWRGPNAGTEEGFGLVSLWPDGRWQHTYQSYGWNARV